jgi:hypothetical protein
MQSQGLVDELNQALTDTVEAQRQAAAKIKNEWLSSKMDYRNRLAIAGEQDPNRRAALEANYMLDQFDFLMGQVATTAPATAEAMQLAQELQDMHVRFREARTQFLEYGTRSGIEKFFNFDTAMAAQVAAATGKLDVEGYVNKPVDSAMQFATELDNATGAVSGFASALDTATASLGTPSNGYNAATWDVDTMGLPLPAGFGWGGTGTDTGSPVTAASYGAANGLEAVASAAYAAASALASIIAGKIMGGITNTAAGLVAAGGVPVPAGLKSYVKGSVGGRVPYYNNTAGGVSTQTLYRGRELIPCEGDS